MPARWSRTDLISRSRIMLTLRETPVGGYYIDTYRNVFYRKHANLILQNKFVTDLVLAEATRRGLWGNDSNWGLF